MVHTRLTAAQQDTLLELALLVAERRDLVSVFRSFAKQLLDGTAFDFASLTALNTEGTEYVTVASFPELAKGARDRFDLVELNPDLMQQHVDGVAYAPQKARIPAGEEMAAFGLRQAWSCPLLDDESAVLGVFTVARYSPERFVQQEQEFLRRAAPFLASAVREERRLAAARNAATRNELIGKLSVLVNTEEPVVDLFGRAEPLLREAIGTDLILLATAGEGDTISLLRSAPILDPYAQTRFTRSAASLLELDSGVEIYTVPDQARVSPWATVLLEEGMDSCAVVPLREQGRTLGVLALARAAGQPWTEADRKCLEVAGVMVAQAMGWDWRYDESLRRLEEQRVIASIISAASSHSDPGELLSAIQAPLARLVTEPVVVFGFQEERTVHFVLPDGSTVDRPFAMERDQETWERLPPMLRNARAIRELGMTTISACVTRAGGETIGYLLVGSTAADQTPFSPRQLRIFRLVAQLIGPVLRHARATALVADERNLLEMALGSLSEGIVLIDNDLQPVYQNTFGRQLIAAGGDPGEHWASILPPEFGIKLRTTAMYQAETRGRSKVELDGEERWLDYAFTPITHQDYRVMLTVRDASEAVALEEREQAHREEMEQAARLAALGSLVGGVAHELNNPLTAVIGFSELLMQTVEDEQAREDLGVIHKEAERARRIVGDLLLIGRPATMERAHIAVPGIFGHLERVRRATWLRDGIAVRFEVNDESLTVWGNEDRITQVVLNLLTNAEDAVAGGASPEIVVRSYREGDAAVLEVRDNGPGMDQATQRHIFEPFFTTKQGSGTGIGLSVSRSIAQAHGGELDVVSAPGEGTCFRLRLPLAEVREEPEEPPVVEELAQGQLRVLVIDDEPSLLQVCQRLVRTMGHECAVAGTPTEAQELASRERFDLVLCDYRLGSAVADEVIEAFQLLDPGLIERTVLATGAMNDEGVQQLIERYHLRLLPKPYGADELAELLNELVPVAQVQVTKASAGGRRAGTGGRSLSRAGWQ